MIRINGKLINKAFIFGTGEYGTEWYGRLKDCIEITGFIDNDPNKQKNDYLGLPVYSVKNLVRPKDSVIIICVYDEIVANEIAKQMENEWGSEYNENLFHLKDFLNELPDEKYLKLFGYSKHSNLSDNDKLLINKIHRQIENEKKLIEVYAHIGKYVTDADQIGDNAIINSSVLINKTIWVCWLQGMEQAPKLVQKCICSIEKNKPDDWNMELITFDNLKQFMELPKFVWEKHKDGNVSNTHLSDIIRLELLNRYGGCWIDATIFCSAKIPLYMLSSQLFVFKWSVMDISILKCSNWWIASYKGNDIINHILCSMYQYWKHENHLLHYLVFHIVFSKIIELSKQNLDAFNSMFYMNNSNPHILQGSLAAPFDLAKWNEIKNISSVHKLTYKQKFSGGKNYTFYDALLEDKLCATESL